MLVHAAVIEWDDESITPGLVIAHSREGMEADVRAEIHELYAARSETPLVLEMRELMERTVDLWWDGFIAALQEVDGPVITTYTMEI